MDSLTEATKRRRFLWGVFLAWAPFIFFVAIAVSIALSEISAQKATGLGAVAGGFSEAFATFGFATAVVFEVIAMVLLFGAFSRGHSLRSLFSVLSICCCLLMLSGFGFFVWLSSATPADR
jgi:hypothetical protein